MRPTATQDEIDGVRRIVEEHGLEAFLSVGEERTVIGVVGSDIERVSHLGTLPGVEQVIRISSPYKLASVEHQVDRTRVRINGVQIGEGQELVVIAGPCAVESREQLFETARCVKREGARVLRGGAFKPRTSPYSFQGLGLPALKLLAEAHESTGMPVVSEVVDPADVPAFEEYIDVLQVGARNMHNFVLLKAVGQSRRPVLLKRGLSATIEEWLLAAEYVLSAGNPNVILCERGIRTFETATRNTLDLSAVPVLRGRTHLPIVVDPSHGTGHRALVAPMALASAAVGADGLIIEVHPDPANARSDGDQSLSFEEFGALMDELRRLQFVRSADSVPAQPQAPSPVAAADGIEEVRDRIDDLDARLAAMVQERAALALEVQRRRAPNAHGHDVNRERALLERAASGTDGPMTPVELTMVFDALLRASRAVQRRHAQSVTEAEAASAGPGG
ncbi:MAG: bifunctional 3-deoxy-7-phosphoheptulonate synthase/chorismate mutase [Candidatus Limnocylindria bacterium]